MLVGFKPQRPVSELLGALPASVQSGYFKPVMSPELSEMKHDFRNKARFRYSEVVRYSIVSGPKRGSDLIVSRISIGPNTPPRH